MKITGIVREKCKADTIPLVVAPPLSDEVFNLAHSYAVDSGIKLEMEDDVLLVKGFAYPGSPQLFNAVTNAIEWAIEEVERERQRKEAELDHLARQYSQISKLPIQ